jgi:FixJ family two-component response regulator
MYKKQLLILVADDDPAVCDALEFSLRLEGFQVHTCRSGSDLLSHPILERCDCILLDYKMPGMNGLDVLGRLSMVLPATPVIFMTGPISDALRRRAIEAGARRVLEKPLQNQILADSIREVSATRN